MLVRIAQSVGLIDKHKYEAVKYDPERSCYNFSAFNLRFSEVKGFFKEAKVKGLFDAYNLDLSYLDIAWPVEGIRTGINERDKQLVEASHFFFGEEYPEILFKSTSIEAYKGKQIIINGHLTIKDTVQELCLYASYSKDKQGYVIFVDYELDRFEFKIGESGSFAIGREIKLQLDIALNF